MKRRRKGRATVESPTPPRDPRDGRYLTEEELNLWYAAIDRAMSKRRSVMRIPAQIDEPMAMRRGPSRRRVQLVRFSPQVRTDPRHD